MSWGAAGAMIGADLIGTLINQGEERSNRHEARMQQSRNIDMQKEFAQNGIRWKMEDAKRAGISPLAALGAQGSSFTPVAIGDTGSSSGTGDFIARTGQNISRAMAAGMSQEEKIQQGLAVHSLRLDVEGKEIENAMKALELNRMSLASPSIPGGSDNMIPGQGNSPLIKINASERTAHQPGIPAQDAGWITDRAYANTGTGLHPVPSKDVTERIEDKIVPEMLWAARNYLSPNFDASLMPSKSQLPSGYDTWNWNPLKSEWQPVKIPAKWSSGYESAPHVTKHQQRGYKPYTRNYKKGG